MVKKSLRTLDYDKIYTHKINNSFDLYSMEDLQKLIEVDENSK